jgi:hypothetical protein
VHFQQRPRQQQSNKTIIIQHQDLEADAHAFKENLEDGSNQLFGAPYFESMGHPTFTVINLRHLSETELLTEGQAAPPAFQESLEANIQQTQMPQHRLQTSDMGVGGGLNNSAAQQQLLQNMANEKRGTSSAIQFSKSEECHSELHIGEVHKSTTPACSSSSTSSSSLNQAPLSKTGIPNAQVDPHIITQGPHFIVFSISIFALSCPYNAKGLSQSQWCLQRIMLGFIRIVLIVYLCELLCNLYVARLLLLLV